MLQWRLTNRLNVGGLLVVVLFNVGGLLVSLNTLMWVAY